MTPTPSPTSRGWRWIGGVAAAIVLVTGAAVAYRSANDDDGASDLDVDVEVGAGPGTALPDGLVVAPGSALIGPAVVEAVDASGTPTSWFAVLLIDGDPIEVWKDYAGQIAGLFPDEGIDPDAVPGCRTVAARADPGPGNGTLCELNADTVDENSERRADAQLVSVRGDVTGRHLLRLDMSTRTGDDMLSDFHEGGGDPWSGDPLPEPQEPRARPQVGDPLAPATVAYPGDDGGGGDNERYVLLDGSELLAQYGEGTITGGFDVVLRVTPGAHVETVATAYADQANQDEDEPVPAPDVVEHDGTTVRIFHPPGGAGGYSGEVIGVDQPGGADDYVFYSLAND